MVVPLPMDSCAVWPVSSSAVAEAGGVVVEMTVIINVNNVKAVAVLTC